VPPHVQVANWIRARIEVGEYGPDDPLPSEKDLKDLFGIARDTAKRAYGVLGVGRADIHGSAARPVRRFSRRAAGMTATTPLWLPLKIAAAGKGRPQSRPYGLCCGGAAQTTA
jgi:DNA-binding transcriptional MocR family regulator